MNSPFVAFFIGAAHGLDEPTASIKKLELQEGLIFQTFDAKPDSDNTAPICFWSSREARPFYNNRTSASSGLLPAALESLDYIQENGKPWRSEAELVNVEGIQTETLDHYCQESGLWPDFLSMDIQGAEFEVLKGGGQALSRLLGIVTEVEFRQIYRGQALFADIAAHLAAQGFQFITLYVPQYWKLRPGDTLKVLTVGEALFLRRPETVRGADRSKLAQIAKCFGLEGYGGGSV